MEESDEAYCAELVNWGGGKMEEEEVERTDLGGTEEMAVKEDERMFLFMVFKGECIEECKGDCMGCCIGDCGRVCMEGCIEWWMGDGERAADRGGEERD